MKFSTKGRYGLRAMLDIAIHSKGDHVALNSIADRQEISMNYLEQVFATLRKAGLVKSVKGAQGGYTLADDPSNIKVGTILRVLEGPLTVIDESGEQTAGSESNLQLYLKTQVWDRMNACMNEVADAYTLEDLANEYRKLNGIDTIMYYI